jgi:hypothetical protein
MCSYHYEHIFIAHDVQTSGKMRNFKCPGMWYIYLPLGCNRTRVCLSVLSKETGGSSVLRKLSLCLSTIIEKLTQVNRWVSCYLCVIGLKVSTGFFGNSEERGWVRNIATELLNAEVHLPDEEANNT